MAIETAAEIHNEVEQIFLPDTAISQSDTISFINKGLKEIAGILLLPALLETEIAIDTVVSTAYASLPSNYMRNLHYCYSNDNHAEIRIYNDVRLLYREFSVLDLSGRVVGVSVAGAKFYYQRIPASSEELRIHYYKYPTVLTLSTDTIDCLPAFSVRPLLVNYVAKEMFSLAENVIKEKKVNTEYYGSLFIEALNKLMFFIGPEARKPQEIREDLFLENYL